MMRVSRFIRNRVRLEPRPDYQIAKTAGVDPSVFSRLINGHVEVKADDPRVLRIAETLNVPISEAFENETTAT